MTLRFRKLYQEPEEGGAVNAIIAYNKFDWLIKKYPDNYAKGWTSTDQYWNEHYVAQYRKRLIIDCWLFVLNFDWKTKEITI
jgi:hypothetical protein